MKIIPKKIHVPMKMYVDMFLTKLEVCIPDDSAALLILSFDKFMK